MITGECFCVNSNILKHSVAMSDPCENFGLDLWSKTYGLGVTSQNETCKLLCIYYLPNQNRLFQMCVIASVSATIINVQLSPTFCEQHKAKFQN